MRPVDAFVRVPGTWENGDPGVPERDEAGARELQNLGLPDAGSRDLGVYTLGETLVILDQEPAGKNGEWLWHLSISHAFRHPTWDEIKAARYRLLPLDLTFGMLLPPPEDYVNLDSQDHVFHLWETTDDREPWTGG
jgi:hypothetical protein